MTAAWDGLAEMLAEHSHHSTAANWTGSPDLGDWRNIRPICRCRERIVEDCNWTATEVAEAHRHHLAAAVTAFLVARLDGAAVRMDVARAIANSQNPGAPQAWHNYRDEWLRDATAALAAVKSAIGGAQ